MEGTTLNSSLEKSSSLHFSASSSLRRSPVVKSRSTMRRKHELRAQTKAFEQWTVLPFTGPAMLCFREVVSSIAHQSICSNPSERFDDRTIQKNGNLGTADQGTVPAIVRECISSDSIY